jgi:serine protease
VTWRAPTQTGGAPITSYLVSVYQAGNGTALRTVTVDGAATSATVDDLVNGTRYTFRVAAVNSAGPSALSSRSNAVTPKG